MFEFTAAVTKLGADTMVDAQPWLVPVAKACEPAELRATINALTEVVHPDRLDDAWAKGMDKRDVSLSRCGDGFHLTGFLDIVTGAAFKTWLDAAAAPAGAEDGRAPSQRRLDAVADLIDGTLAHGMPTDRGVRPQLHVAVDADTLAGDPAGAPATLIGFGSIGAHLLGYLRCVSDTTAVLVHGETGGPTPQPNVLDVGRTSRLATAKQRTAVLARQRGVCATPGCHHTHLEIHHSIWWSAGGPTDLDNLVGLCTRCHHLVHQEKLTVTADGHGGFTFTRTSGATLVDDHRRQQGAVRHRLRALRHAVHADEPAHASSVVHLAASPGSAAGAGRGPLQGADRWRDRASRAQPSPLTSTGRSRRPCWDIQHPGTSTLERHVTIHVQPHRRT